MDPEKSSEFRALLPVSLYLWLSGRSAPSPSASAASPLEFIMDENPELFSALTDEFSRETLELHARIAALQETLKDHDPSFVLDSSPHLARLQRTASEISLLHNEIAELHRAKATEGAVGDLEDLSQFVSAALVNAEGKAPSPNEIVSSDSIWQQLHQLLALQHEEKARKHEEVLGMQAAVRASQLTLSCMLTSGELSAELRNEVAALFNEATQAGAHPSLPRLSKSLSSLEAMKLRLLRSQQSREQNDISEALAGRHRVLARQMDLHESFFGRAGAPELLSVSASGLLEYFANEEEILTKVLNYASSSVEERRLGPVGESGAQETIAELERQISDLHAQQQGSGGDIATREEDYLDLIGSLTQQNSELLALILDDPKAKSKFSSSSMSKDAAFSNRTPLTDEAIEDELNQLKQEIAEEAKDVERSLTSSRRKRTKSAYSPNKDWSSPPGSVEPESLQKRLIETEAKYMLLQQPIAARNDGKFQIFRNKLKEQNRELKKLMDDRFGIMDSLERMREKNDKLARQVSSHASLKDKLRVMHTDYSSRERLIDEMRQEVLKHDERMKKALRKARYERFQLLRTVSELSAQVNSVVVRKHKKVKLPESIGSALGGTIGQLEESLERANAVAVEKHGELEGLQQAFEDLKIRYGVAGEKLRAAAAQEQLLVQRVATLESELQETHTGFAAAKNESSQKHSVGEKLQQELEGLRTEHEMHRSGLEQKITKLATKKSALKQEKQSLTEDLEGKSKAITQLNEDRNTLNSHLGDKGKLISSGEEEITRLRETLAKAKQKAKDLENKLTQEIQQLTQKAQENQQAHDTDASEAVQRLEDSQAQTQTQQDSCAQTQEQLDAAKTQITEQEAALAALAENHALQLQGLTEQLTAQTAEHAEILGKLQAELAEKSAEKAPSEAASETPSKHSCSSKKKAGKAPAKPKEEEKKAKPDPKAKKK